MDADARLEVVENENELLRERIHVLETLLGMNLKAPLIFRLTPHEASVLGVLMARDFASKDTILAAVYRDLGRDEPEIKIVDVFVCKIRKKVKAFEIDIETMWGHGYRITPVMKDKVRKLMEAEGILVDDNNKEE